MKHIRHYTIDPKVFARMPKGTEAAFIVDWDKAARVQQLVQAYFTRINGRVSFETYHSTHLKTGETFKTLIAVVIKRGKRLT